MKKLYLMLLMVAAGLAATAQTDTPPIPVPGPDEVYTVVEHEPEFHGGMERLYQYLATNIQYPEEAKAKNIGGKVIVKFVIEKDGHVREVKAVESPDPLLSEEAERVVKAMPRWKPGRTKAGKKVRVQYMLPINFQL